MTRGKVVLWCAALVFSANCLFAQTTYTWIGVTGDWDVSTNWSPEGIPGSADTAICNGGTLALTGDVTVADLEIAANLTGDYDLDITHLMIWNGQSIEGSGTLTISANATLRLAGSNQQTLRRNLVNNGTTIWEAGHFALFDGITFTNNGTFLDAHGVSESFSGGTYSCDLINNGIYRKTGASVTTLSLPITNDGNLECNAGEIRFGPGSSSDSITVASGALLKFQGTSWDISGSISGAGSVEFWASTTTINSDYNITGSTYIAQNTTIFDTTATITSLNNGDELYITGTAEFNTGNPLTLDTLYLAGNLQGRDSVAIMDQMIWVNNVVGGSGTLNITAEATLRLAGSNQQTLRRNLVNNGTTIWEDGNLSLWDGITFTNNGTFLDQVTVGEPFSGGSYGCDLINNGTYTKTGSGINTFSIPLTNNGTFEINAGEVRFSNVTSSGAITVADGSLLKFQGTSLDITGPISGAGSIEFWGATTINGEYNITGNTYIASNTTIFDSSATIISLNNGQLMYITGTAEFNTDDPVAIDSLYLYGQLQGSDSIAILKYMNWAGKSVQGSGTLNIAAEAVLRLSGSNQQSLYRNLVNNGTTRWEAGNFYLAGGITFTNNGMFHDQIAVSEPFSGGASGCDFINNGTYSKTGAGLSGLSIPFYNNPGGCIRGTGDINLTYGLTNEGAVSPGDSLGTLNLTVNFPATATSELNIEIGGTTADTLYDRLNIAGDATLDGTLTVELVNGFVPALGDTFIIMTYQSYSGNFDSVNLPETDGGLTFTVDITGQKIRLTAAETPNSAPTTFNLHAPADELVLTAIDTLNFIWHASTDADEDTLHYTLHIFGGTLDTSITDIADTTFTTIGEEMWQANTVYQWTVLASDGLATTVSPDTFSFTSPLVLSIEDPVSIPDEYRLEQNYPNPFNPSTTISYQLPVAGKAYLAIYNMLGQQVWQKQIDRQPAGRYEITIDLGKQASGLYFYRLEAGNFGQTRKMVLLK